MNVTDDQLNTLGELADEIDNLTAAAQLGMPAAFHLKQLERVLPELAEKIRAWVAEVSGANPWEEER